MESGLSSLTYDQGDHLARSGQRLYRRESADSISFSALKYHDTIPMGKFTRDLASAERVATDRRYSRRSITNLTKAWAVGDSGACSCAR